jgi:hypothetical protein
MRARCMHGRIYTHKNLWLAHSQRKKERSAAVYQHHWGLKYLETTILVLYWRARLFFIPARAFSLSRALYACFDVLIYAL